MELSLVVNTRDCVGCYACEVACKQEHNLPVGPRLIRVNPDGPRMINGKLQLRYKLDYCQHCENPACKDACPVNAISVTEDGIVTINTALCNGCQKCAASCPTGVMQFDEVKRIALKCDLCTSRLDRGLKPACATVCPSHCIYFGSKKEVLRKLEKSCRTEIKI